MTDGVTDTDALSEAETSFIAAAKHLVTAGMSRTQLYDILREHLPPSHWNEQQHRIAVRDIQIFREIMGDFQVSIHELRERYSLPSLQKTTAIGTGTRKVRVVLGLSWCDHFPHQVWQQHCDEALEVLRHKSFCELKRS